MKLLYSIIRADAVNFY